MPPDNPSIPLPYKDVTIKACINDFARIEEMLITLGAVYIGHDAQTDYYFETANGKLKLRQGTIENIIIHYRRDGADGIEKTTVFRSKKTQQPARLTC